MAALFDWFRTLLPHGPEAWVTVLSAVLLVMFAFTIALAAGIIGRTLVRGEPPRR